MTAQIEGYGAFLGIDIRERAEQVLRSVSNEFADEEVIGFQAQLAREVDEMVLVPITLLRTNEMS